MYYVIKHLALSFHPVSPWQENRDAELNDDLEIFLLTQLGFMMMLKTGKASNEWPRAAERERGGVGAI